MKENKIWTTIKKSHILYFLLVGLLYAVKGILYFLIQKIPNEPYHFHMAIDEFIPFIKYFYVFYVSYYILPFILLYIISFYDKRKYWKLFFAASLSTLISCFIFCIFQVQMIRPDGYDNVYHSLNDALNGFSSSKNISDFFDVCIKTQYYLDEGALNCFPSIHCAFGTLEIIYGIRLFKDEKKLNKGLMITSIVFGVGTILATVFIKQHYLVDSLAGITNMILCYIAAHFIFKAIEKKKNTNTEKIENEERFD